MIWESVWQDASGDVWGWPYGHAHDGQLGYMGLGYIDDSWTAKDIIARNGGPLRQLVPAEPLDEKGRGPTYWRGHADGRNYERAQGIGPGTVDEDYEHVAFAGGPDPDNAAVVDSFGMDRAAAEEHARWLVEGGVARRRDPEQTAGPWQLIDGWQDPDGESWIRDEPPFAPELADAPIRVGPSGVLAPMVVDEPIHDSTLPAELSTGPLRDFPSDRDTDEGTHYPGDGCDPPHADPTTGRA